MLQFINLLFGCWHRRTTFPVTPRKSGGSTLAGATRFGTYVACLDCGKELAYDWNEMRMGAPVRQRYPSPEVQPSFR